MTIETPETIIDLTSVRGSAGDAKQCFDAVWPWAAEAGIGGAIGLGPLSGLALGASAGLTAYLTSPACGDGTKTPATLLREKAAASLPSVVEKLGQLGP